MPETPSVQELCERLTQRHEPSEPLSASLGAARRRIAEPAAQPGQVPRTFSTLPSCDELAKPVLDVGRERRQVFDILPIKWMHPASTSKLNLIFVHNRRNTKGMNAAGVLPEFTVHDAWARYDTCARIMHALCNTYTLRKFQAVRHHPVLGAAKCILR